MKKSLIFLAFFALASCVFDAKDSCLDSGGSYDEATKTCQHSPEKTPENSQKDSSEIPSTSENSHSLGAEYPSSLTESVAAKFCVEKGGKIAIEKQNEVDILYCEIASEKHDAWKFLNDNQ